jgi:hypothetical protein
VPPTPSSIFCQQPVLLQCVILSVGRFDDCYIITEEPDPGDRLISHLRTAISTKKNMPSTTSHDYGLHLKLPFELRCLEVVLDEAAKLLAVEVRGIVRSAKHRMVALSRQAVRPLTHGPCCAAHAHTPEVCTQTQLLCSTKVLEAHAIVSGSQSAYASGLVGRVSPGCADLRLSKLRMSRLVNMVVQKASKSVLDQLKSIRSNMIALTTRVRKFKSELEDILDDDQDMCAVRPHAPRQLLVAPGCFTVHVCYFVALITNKSS